MIEHLESRIAPATFIVTSLADTGAGSLREAIESANDSPGPDVIRFSNELTGTVTVLNGAMRIEGPLSIIGPGASKLKLDATSMSQIFQIDDGDASTDSRATISGLTFKGGRADDALGEEGGAIFSLESLQVTSCLFANNDADAGGAIFVEQPNSGGTLLSVSIQKSDFLQNIALINGGAAIAVDVAGSVTLKNNSFDRNQNAQGAGTGAIKIKVGDGERLLVEKCQFTGNFGSSIGAADLRQDMDNGSVVIVRDSIFLGNAATGQSTGAVHLSGGAKLIFERNVLVHNTAEQSGGALTADNFELLIIRGSRFEGNAANGNQNNQGGGGLHINIPSDSTAQIVNSFIVGNQAENGAGLLIGNGIGSLKIVGSAIDGNRAGNTGAGIYRIADTTTDLSASVELVKSKLLNNFAAVVGGGFYAEGDGVISVKGSIIAQNTSSLGGGMYFESSVTPATVIGSTISKNTADEGGGILSKRPLELRASKVIANTSATLGGGVSAKVSLLVDGCLFTRNIGTDGSAIAQSATEPMVIRKSKIFANPSSTGVEVSDP